MNAYALIRKWSQARASDGYFGWKSGPVFEHVALYPFLMNKYQTFPLNFRF